MSRSSAAVASGNMPGYRHTACVLLCLAATALLVIALNIDTQGNPVRYNGALFLGTIAFVVWGISYYFFLATPVAPAPVAHSAPRVTTRSARTQARPRRQLARHAVRARLLVRHAYRYARHHPEPILVRVYRTC